MRCDFTGRHVVVTGGTGALGCAVVERLIECEATCHVPCRKEADLERYPFRDHAQVRIAMGVELADEKAVERLYAPLGELWASIHVAGGYTMAPIAQTSLADFRRMMDTNAVTCFLCCREAVKKIRASGKGGRIVNVAARPALRPAGGRTAYAASKASVVAITLGLAEEVAAEGIWVNAVVPSIMDTPANRLAMPHADSSKWAKVEEVAATIAFLASSQNAVTRGALVPVYGRS
jgi:NAD(P)-dependent dehydrogenase (short-subunit alcohol dehydrogenase family)